MTTYVFTRSEGSGWSPRTSYADNPEGAKRKTADIIFSEYDAADADTPAMVTGVLLIYFAGGAVVGSPRPQDMPEVFEYTVERVLPKLVRVV